MKLGGDLLWIHDAKRSSAASNMALDEHLLLMAERPLVRTYGWIRPSVSFGYFTRWSEVANYAATRDLVRRWTGGGVVEHGHDFTYSLVLPVSVEKAVTVYREVHSRMGKVLQEDGFPVEMAETAEPRVSARCFAQAALFDLRLDGAKIAGAAIRRHRAGLLLQGSLQTIRVSAGFPARFAEALGASKRAEGVTPEDRQAAEVLARNKYSLTSWTRKF